MTFGQSNVLNQDHIRVYDDMVCITPALKTAEH